MKIFNTRFNTVFILLLNTTLYSASDDKSSLFLGLESLATSQLTRSSLYPHAAFQNSRKRTIREEKFNNKSKCARVSRPDLVDRYSAKLYCAVVSKNTLGIIQIFQSARKELSETLITKLLNSHRYEHYLNELIKHQQFNALFKLHTFRLLPYANQAFIDTWNKSFVRLQSRDNDIVYFFIPAAAQHSKNILDFLMNTTGLTCTQDPMFRTDTIITPFSLHTLTYLQAVMHKAYRTKYTVPESGNTKPICIVPSQLPESTSQTHIQEIFHAAEYLETSTLIQKSIKSAIAAWETKNLQT